jgi:hypothetical protein
MHVHFPPFSKSAPSCHLLLCPQAAAKFRQFWGDKAELRRFQDGNIAEAVVWECGPAERHSVVDRSAPPHCSVTSCCCSCSSMSCH